MCHRQSYWSQPPLQFFSNFRRRREWFFFVVDESSTNRRQKVTPKGDLTITLLSLHDVHQVYIPAPFSFKPQESWIMTKCSVLSNKSLLVMVIVVLCRRSVLCVGLAEPLIWCTHLAPFITLALVQFVVHLGPQKPVDNKVDEKNRKVIIHFMCQTRPSRVWLPHTELLQDNTLGTHALMNKIITFGRWKDQQFVMAPRWWGLTRLFTLYEQLRKLLTPLISPLLSNHTHHLSSYYRYHSASSHLQVTHKTRGKKKPIFFL